MSITFNPPLRHLSWKWTGRYILLKSDIHDFKCSNYILEIEFTSTLFIVTESQLLAIDRRKKQQSMDKEKDSNHDDKLVRPLGMT